jgi:hypothetical protein
MPAFSTNRRRLRLAVRLQGGGCSRTFLVFALNMIRRTPPDYIHVTIGGSGAELHLINDSIPRLNLLPSTARQSVSLEPSAQRIVFK